MHPMLIFYGADGPSRLFGFCRVVFSGQTDDCGIARADFNRLPIDQRYETQALLGRAGYWPGVVTEAVGDGAFSPRDVLNRR